MFKDYVREVVREYHSKVASNTISLNLIKLTPGNVKKECKAVCLQRFRRADERMLRDVFGYAENIAGYLRAIERCDIDKFRPMIYFIEGRIKDTDVKNVELLAWLIDFNDRPFDNNGKYGGVNQLTASDDSKGVVDASPSLKNDSKQLISPATSRQPMLTRDRSSVKNLAKLTSKPKVLVFALIVAILGGTVANLSSNNSKSSARIGNSDSCMYWKGDHYERVSCGQKVKFANVIALDTFLLNNFRRIINTDTITYNSIGKVWYVKISGKPEYYTAMGYHPVYTQIQLKAITKYIIDKYIVGNAIEDSLGRDSIAASIAPNHADSFKLSYKKLKTHSWGIYGQCQAMTKEKTRCLRSAQRGGFCWQHAKHS